MQAALELIMHQAWPDAHSDPPAPAPQVLGLQTCATIQCWSFQKAWIVSPVTGEFHGATVFFPFSFPVTKVLPQPAKFGEVGSGRDIFSLFSESRVEKCRYVLMR